MIYGYARCSTNETKQDIDRQVRELKAAGAEKVYLEYEHGDSSVKQQSLYNIQPFASIVSTIFSVIIF